jgi:hypothetical protein
MANIKICSQCGKVGLDQYDFGVFWSVRCYYYNSKCKKCENERTKNWKRENKEHISESNKNWKQENLDKVRQCRIKYRQNNQNKVKQCVRSWQQSNPDKCNQNSRKWQQNNPYKCNQISSKRRALKRNQTPDLTQNEKKKVELYYWVSQQFGPEWEVDHIIPISKGGIHHPDNLQIVTKEYNRQKHNNENFREPTALEHWRI